MCTVLLPLGVNSIEVDKYIIQYHIISYHTFHIDCALPAWYASKLQSKTRSFQWLNSLAGQSTEHFSSQYNFYCAHRAENEPDEQSSITVNNLEIARKFVLLLNGKLVELRLRRHF